jgi:hypothetical protein
MDKYKKLEEEKRKRAAVEQLQAIRSSKFNMKEVEYLRVS